MMFRAFAISICFAAALCVFAVVILVTGGHPVEVFRTLATGGADSAYGFTETVVKAIPVLLCAVAAAVPGRFGLVNIGAEGQLLAGAIGAMFVARNLPGLSAAPTLFLMAVGAGAPVVEGCSVVGVAAVGVDVDVVPSEAWVDAESLPHPARPTQPTIRAKRICRPADAEFMAVNHRVRLVVRPELSPGVPGFRSGTHAIVALRPVGR